MIWWMFWWTSYTKFSIYGNSYIDLDENALKKIANVGKIS